MSEVWKPAPGLEGYYEVSNEGRVRNVPRQAGTRYIEQQIIKLQSDKDGYLTFHSAKRGIRKHEKVHRLVALAFIPNPDWLPVVNHVDEDKRNVRVSNLEWVTHKGNINHGTCIERRSKTKKIPVFGINPTTKDIRYYIGMVDAVKDGFCNNHISSCLAGKLKHHRGYRWYPAKQIYRIDMEG